MERSVQLDFRCRSCHLAGLTHGVTRQEALSLARGQLELRCPKCGAILSIQTSEIDLLSRAMTLIGATREELTRALTEELVKRRDD